jgi:hypothetical protein
MVKLLYCWRCNIEVPVVEKHEWAQIMQSGPNHSDMLQKYNEITNYNETNFNAVLHHRLIDFGPPCKSCGKPLRTAQANFCAECGASR